MQGEVLECASLRWTGIDGDRQYAFYRAANDFSGTLMEENISKAAGATFGEYVSPQDFRRMIRSIGRIPAERTTTYKICHLYNDSDEAQATPAQPQLNLLQNAPHVSYAEGAY